MQRLLLVLAIAGLSFACSCASREVKPLIADSAPAPAVATEVPAVIEGGAETPAPAAMETSTPNTPEPPADVVFDHSHANWTKLLAEYVKPNGVDYRGLRSKKRELDTYLATLQGTTRADMTGWSREERFAFWINVYNAYIVRVVVDNYPLDSIKDLGGKLVGKIWDKEIIPMPDHDPDGKGGLLSFNDVEHEILRARFPDARVHAAINCASTSCPPLLTEAFVASKLDEQLDGVMRAFVNDPTRNRVDQGKNTLYLSKIFDWFAGDFERDADSVRGFIARFAPGDTGWIAEAKISHLDYSWKLNDAP